MEAIKKLLRPGAAEDDNTLYGQGNTTDAKNQNLGHTGEGSHLSSSRDQPGLPGKHISSVPDSTSHQTGVFTGHGGVISGAPESSTLGQSQSAGLGHGSLDPGATRPIGGSGLGHGQHERADPANMEVTALGGSSGLGGNHSKSTSTTQGPHSSDMMNKLDPRVDSNQSTSRTSDSTGNYATTTTGVAHSGHGNPTDASRGNTSLPGYGIVQGQTATGPHPAVDSNFANARRAADESGNRGGAGAGMATLGHREQDYSSSTRHGNPILGQSSQSSTTHGPHSSDLMNKLDPKVDSDNSRNINSGAGYSSTTGSSHQTGIVGSGISGPHQTMAANLLDPHVNTAGRGHEDAIHHDQKHGGGAEEADNDHRDAGKKAAVAGAVGLGAIGLGSSDHPSRFTERGADGSAGGSTSLMPGTFPGETAHLTGSDFQPGSQNVSTIPDRTRVANDPTSSIGQKESHHGRDAALVGGAAGLGGAAYAASKHSDNKSSEPVHDSSMLNRADPRVSTGNSGTAYGANPVDRSHGIMTGATTTHQPSQTTTGTSDIDNVHGQQPHHGRDAALGAGVGAGAAGAAYGLGRQHESHPQGVQTTTTTTTSTSTSTAGTHSSDMLNRADPRVDSDRSREQGKDHNYDRDAALVGGAGAAAIGARQLGDRDEKDLKNAQKQHDKLVHEQEKVDKERAHAAEKERQHREKEHEKQLRDNDKRDTKDEKHEKEHKGLFSFLHRDKSKKYTQEEEDDFARQEREYNSSTSSSTIVGAAQIGGTSLGDKLHGTERNRGVIGSSGFPHGHGPDTNVNQHTGEPLIGSAVPSHQTAPYTGTAAHQNTPLTGPSAHHNSPQTGTGVHHDTSHAGTSAHHTTHGGNTLVGSSQIGGTSLGDKLHGEERNRGVTGPSGFPHGHGLDTNINQHTGEPLGSNVGGHQTAAHTGIAGTSAHQTTHGSNTTTDDGLTHSHSRSGAMGEPKQSVNEYNSSRGKQGDILSPTTDSYTHSGTGSSSYGTEAAPRHLTSEQKADASGDGILDANSGVKTTQGVHAGESQGVAVATRDDGRNRLHKDPPAGRF